MPVSLNIQSGAATVAVSGDATPELLRDIRQHCEQALEVPDCARLDLDLSALDSLDSAMLGVLLLVKEKAMGRGTALRLLGIQGQALKQFQAARFDRMFTLA